jgi:hypothetical protein
MNSDIYSKQKKEGSVICLSREGICTAALSLFAMGVAVGALIVVLLLK